MRPVCLRTRNVIFTIARFHALMHRIRVINNHVLYSSSLLAGKVQPHVGLLDPGCFPKSKSIVEVVARCGIGPGDPCAT